MVKYLSINIIRRSIRYIKKVPYVESKIVIGDFSEIFDMRIDWWTIKDYEHQWQTGIERLQNHDTSCLVTEVANPHIYGLINWWLLYKEGNLIYIRNQIIFPEYYEELIGDKEFTPQSCYGFIGPKIPKLLENGKLLSEWVISWEE